MKGEKRGKNISAVEVTNISARGFWLLIKDREYFVDFDQNPWFKNARVGQILQVRFLHGHHLYWPELDVDLELGSLVGPENYPLVYR